MNQTTIFTDGGCSPNPGKGAWAFVVVKNEEIIHHSSGFDPKTTNNRMEYIAVIKAIEYCHHENFQATIHSDSKLLVQTFNEWVFSWANRNWKRKEGPIKNLDLVQKIWLLKQNQQVKISVKWIKGHNGNKWNEYADKLCGLQIKHKGKVIINESIIRNEIETTIEAPNSDEQNKEYRGSS